MLWLIAILGAVGVLCRYSLSQFANQWVSANITNTPIAVGFPVGTLLVNVLGSLLMGFLFSLFLYKIELAEPVKNAVLVGFLGGFTTFSSFSIEMVGFIEAQQWLMAFSYALLSVLLCVSMCFLGVCLGKMLAG